jgi:hypothetical protein
MRALILLALLQISVLILPSALLEGAEPNRTSELLGTWSGSCEHGEGRGGIVDGIVEDEVLTHLDRIKVYPIEIKSEDDLVREIVRIANLSMKLGYQLEKENRMLSKEEAYVQFGHSASLLKAVLDYMRQQEGGE